MKNDKWKNIILSFLGLFKNKILVLKNELKLKLKSKSSKIQVNKKDATKNKKDKNSKRIWKGRLIQKLTLLVICIFIVSSVSSVFIYFTNNEVTKNSVELEEAAELEQKYTLLFTSAKQIGLLQFQLLTTSYDELLTDELQELLIDYEQNYLEINNLIQGDETLERYFIHLEEAFSTYQNLYDEHFTERFLSDRLEDMRMRILPHILRTEQSINSVNQRILDHLALLKEEASTQLETSITRSSFITILVSVVMVVLPIIFLIVFGNNISSGVKLLMNRINAYKNGDLDYIQKTKRRDEFNDIDISLAELGVSLHELLESNQLAGQKVTHVTEQTSAASKQQLDGMKSLQRFISDFTSEIDKQADFTTAISSVTEQVSASSEEMGSSIELMTHQMGEVDNSSELGVELMKELQKTMSELSGNALRSVNKVTEMEEQIKKINSFVEGIDNIASQTNLLALNASIEAARAGKVGDGFAVVANEIRKLSNETNQFSSSTKGVLKSLGVETISVVEAFNVLLKQSNDLVEKTNVAAEKFEDISLKNNHLSTGHNEMNSVVLEINRAMEEVVDSVSQLVDGAKSIQKNNEMSKEVIEEQTARQQVLDQLTDSLFETAKSLKTTY